jgi:FAD/FMN-containing dehydrogenase
MTSTETKFIWRDAEGYEEARIGRVFNHRRPNRYPQGVVEATCVQDIVNAVNLARDKGLRVSVRSGGHSWAAWSVRDEAILIDLGKFKFVEYDEATTIAKVSPSTTGRVVNEYLNTKGRSFAGGHCPDVGLGGFLLQGGMGWNCRVYRYPVQYTRFELTLYIRTGVGHVNKSQPLMLSRPREELYNAVPWKM